MTSVTTKHRFLKLLNNSGSILILALWIVSLLSIIIIPLASYLNKSIELNRRIQLRQRLNIIAESALKKALNFLKFNDDTVDYDSLKDTWINNIVEFKDMEFDDGVATISYTDGGINIYYGIMDEERKLDINDSELANEDNLKRLFMMTTSLSEYEALGLADSLIDWRDQDTNALTYGAENNYYNSLNPPYMAKNEEIKLIEELLFIKGFDQDIIDNISPFISVYHSGKININTVGEKVLLSLGISSDTVNDILSYRRGPDGIDGTLDDRVFEKVGAIFTALGKDPDSEPVLNQLITNNKIDVRSSHFRIEVLAKLTKEKLAKKLICVVNRQGKCYYSYGYFFSEE